MKTKKIFIQIAAVLLLFNCLDSYAQFRLTLAPYLQDVRENEVTIIWETNEPANGWVELAPDDGSNFYSQKWPKSYDSFMGIKNIGTLHRVTVKNLEPGTTYRYRVLSQKALFSDNPDETLYGEYAATTIYRSRPLEFTTAEKISDTFRFAVMNDVHEDSTLFWNLYEAGKIKDCDFVVFNGDMVSSMPEQNTIRDKFLRYATSTFASEKPFWMVRGNHETRSRYAETYMDYFKTPTGLPYYTYTVGNTFFIILDSGEDKPDDDIEYFGRSDYDTYRKEEAIWLKKILASDACKKAEHRIAIMHIPPVGTTSWYGDREVRRLFLPLLNEADIDFMLCGHTHNYSYHEADKFENKFPVLVNDNETVVNVDIDKNNISVQIFDRTGKLQKKFKY